MAVPIEWHGCHEDSKTVSPELKKMIARQQHRTTLPIRCSPDYGRSRRRN